MSAEATIITAIHNIKSNHGSETPGVDFKTMRKDYLERPYQWVIQDIQNAFKHFEVQKIRRKYIDKPGKAEKRPLGIPTIRDRIVQECMKIVLEPILEAQFFEHSYGFRPMRDTAMALARINQVAHTSAKYWIVEGDISKCFDNIDHGILLNRLYHIGIRDRRVLQIIKAMLRAGIMDECTVNEYGTPQGGIISPLLANAYLDIMDEWVTKQWEHKKTRRTYRTAGTKRRSLYQTSLNPGWLIRYADDFVIITDTRAHAEQWKSRLQTFLQDKYGVTDFFVGRYGRFDALAAKAVKEAKKRHPEVTLTLVLPYHPALRPVDSPPGFDATYYPWENEHIPKRLAILKTNQRMVDTCDHLIAYAFHFLGGSGQIVAYARKREEKGLIHVTNLAQQRSAI